MKKKEAKEKKNFSVDIKMHEENIDKKRENDLNEFKKSISLKEHKNGFNFYKKNQ
jgi:hypothetical protein